MVLISRSCQSDGPILRSNSARTRGFVYICHRGGIPHIKMTGFRRERDRNRQKRVVHVCVRVINATQALHTSLTHGRTSVLSLDRTGESWQGAPKRMGRKNQGRASLQKNAASLSLRSARAGVFVRFRFGLASVSVCVCFSVYYLCEAQTLGPRSQHHTHTPHAL